jgi:hypothetical protein
MIPNTVYTFNGDTFTFQEAAGPVTMSFTITGAYTGPELSLYLQTQMIAQSLATGNTYTYTVLYDVPTGKLSFTETHNFSILAATVTFPFYRLGFNAVNVGPALSITSPNVCNLQPPKICLLELGNLTVAEKVQQTIHGDLGHFIIPMSTNSFDIADFYEKSEFDNVVSTSPSDNLNVIRFRLYEPEGHTDLAIQNDWIAVFRLE